MVALKLALGFCVLLLAEAADLSLPKKPTLVKTFHASYFDRIHEVSDADVNNTEGGAIVLKSNLPAAVQTRLASALTAIYQSTSDNLQRAQQFQTTLTRMYSVYWNVVIDFDVITFYSQYYILLQINNDRVLGFGLS